MTVQVKQVQSLKKPLFLKLIHLIFQRPLVGHKRYLKYSWQDNNFIKEDKNNKTGDFICLYYWCIYNIIMQHGKLVSDLKRY